MTKPYGMYAERSGGRLLLHGGNSIRNVGRGPLEVNGVHDRRYSMTARQRIHRFGGGSVTRPISNRVVWKRIPGQGHYWKFDHAAALELWSIDSRGRRIAEVRASPKLVYCLRDLKHPFPRLSGSPAQRHYPACSQTLGISGRTLGTSVGWSDDYPSGYYEQWIDVTGLRGRFAYVMRVDPLGSLYESDKTNNTNSAIVRLPPVNGRFLVGGAINPPRNDGYDYTGILVPPRPAPAVRAAGGQPRRATGMSTNVRDPRELGDALGDLVRGQARHPLGAELLRR